MKLELTLPALERLIDGDNNLEVSLKKQIVQEFARRHLTDVAKQESYTAALDAAKQYVNEAAKESFGIENLVTSHLWPTVGYRLKSMIETLVKEYALKAVEDSIGKLLDSYKIYWRKEVTDAVNKAIEKDIEKLVSEGIQKRLEAASSLI